MAKVELELPSAFLFTMEMPLRVSDMNYANHLGNDRVLGLAQEVRVAWLRAHGLHELDAAGSGVLGKVGIIVADAAVVYRAEGHLGMVVEASVGVGDVRSRSVELLYRLVDRGSGQELARVKTGVVAFDYQLRKVVALPETFRRALGLARDPEQAEPRGTADGVPSGQSRPG